MFLRSVGEVERQAPVTINKIGFSRESNTYLGVACKLRLWSFLSRRNSR
jgi:hypothetical protein